MPPIIGIDLGTTNSLVAYVDYRTGLPRVIPDRREQVLVPSIVSFTSEGPVVGDEARRLLAQEPGSTVFSAKRLLGRSYDDAASELDERGGVFFGLGRALAAGETDEFDAHGLPFVWLMFRSIWNDTPTVAIAIAIAAKNYLVVIRIDSRKLGLFQ